MVCTELGWAEGLKVGHQDICAGGRGRKGPQAGCRVGVIARLW